MTEELFDLLAPSARSLGLELVDVELTAGVARVVLDREGGIDLDTLGEATKVVSAFFDRHDPFPGQRYTLEVTSPGLERALRRREHFERAVGSLLSVRTRPGAGLDRRMKGRLAAAGEAGIMLVLAEETSLEETCDSGGRAGEAEVQERFIAYEDIERAKTVFEWPVPKRPGRTGRNGARKGRSSKHPARGAGARKTRSAGSLDVEVGVR
jgi:ribosome maturation factor RimP